MTAKHIRLIEPSPEDLSFRRELLMDEATMSYNHAYGGTIPFEKDQWQKWYERWLRDPSQQHFYRYVLDQDRNVCVGEAALHYEAERGIWLIHVLIAAAKRNKGYGTQTLDLLCKQAKKQGITALYDDIALDNPSLALFLKAGFEEQYRTDAFVMVRKLL